MDNGNCHTTYSGGVQCTDDVSVQWGGNVVLLQRSGDLVSKPAPRTLRVSVSRQCGDYRKEALRVEIGTSLLLAMHL